MRRPLVVRPFTEAERQAILAGLRSSDAFVLRRCQILLASARGQHAPQIASALGCNEQTVRNAIHSFHVAGLTSLHRASSRPRSTHPAFDAGGAMSLFAILRQSPRHFGKLANRWTLELAADVSYEQGLTAQRVTGETIRATLARHGVSWTRAKQWLPGAGVGHTAGQVRRRPSRWATPLRPDGASERTAEGAPDGSTGASRPAPYRGAPRYSREGTLNL